MIEMRRDVPRPKQTLCLFCDTSMLGVLQHFWGETDLDGTQESNTSCIIDHALTKHQAEQDGAAVFVQHLQHCH